MTLSFSKTQFVWTILSGQKIHTFRKDERNLWKAGDKIEFWKGDPLDDKTSSYLFAEGKVKEVKPIEIKYGIFFNGPEVTIGGEIVQDMNLLAFEDGFFSIDEFFEWFNNDWTGKIIYWEEDSLVRKITDSEIIERMI